MMRLLVTGSDGYIGSVLVPILRAAGHEVVGLDTLYFENESCERAATARTLVKDLRDVTAEELEGFEAVCHLAALSNDPLGELNASWTSDINLRGSVEFARLARRVGVRRFIVASSCSIYGANGTDTPLDEAAPLRPLTAYARSKVDMELEISRLADDRFSPVFLRNATAYGASPRLRLDVVLNNLVATATTMGRIRLTSDGTPWRPLVHVEDISRVFLAVLEAPAEVVHNQAFNVGMDSENFQVRQIAEIVAQVVPGSTIEFAPGSGPDPRTYRVAFHKLRETFPGLDFGWSAARGAAELHHCIQRMGLTADDLYSPRFIRINHLKALVQAKQLDDTLRWRGSSA